jgi:hypothetical protein
MPPRRNEHLADRLNGVRAWPGSRVVVPDLPHHVTQRGNRREPVCFEADDYRLYRRLVAVWAYFPTVIPRNRMQQIN